MKSNAKLLQGAQLNVLAYPHDLRVFAVANCVALDARELSPAELLARGAAQVCISTSGNLHQHPPSESKLLFC